MVSVYFILLQAAYIVWLWHTICRLLLRCHLCVIQNSKIKIWSYYFANIYNTLHYTDENITSPDSRWFSYLVDSRQQLLIKWLRAWITPTPRIYWDQISFSTIYKIHSPQLSVRITVSLVAKRYPKVKFFRGRCSKQKFGFRLGFYE